jgi:hypothetical protein
VQAKQDLCRVPKFSLHRSRCPYPRVARCTPQTAQPTPTLGNGAALEAVKLTEPLALAPDHAVAVTRILRKISELSRRLAIVEARISRIKVRPCQQRCPAVRQGSSYHIGNPRQW